MNKGAHRDPVRQYVPRELLPEERVCLTCQRPDCNWLPSVDGYLCKIQRAAKQKDKS